MNLEHAAHVVNHASQTLAQEYDAIRAMNWSTLKRIHTSPLLYKWRVDRPEPDKDAYRLGRALHCASLEPDRFAYAYIAQPHFGDGRTKEAKEAKRAWLAQLPANAEILSADDYEHISRAGAALRAHRVASQILRGGRCEEIVTWTDPETGLACKGRLDYVRPDFLTDLKSSAEVGLRFANSAARYLYHGQVAFYHDGARASGALPSDAELPRIVAVQLAEPYDVACYRVSEATLEAGRRLYRSLLTRFVECQAADVWPGCAPDLLELDLPPWAAGMGDEEVEDFAL